MEIKSVALIGIDEQMKKQHAPLCRIPYENRPSILQDIEAKRKT